MVKNPLKKFMVDNPYWEIFDWHPMNLALKKTKRKSDPSELKDKQ